MSAGVDREIAKLKGICAHETLETVVDSHDYYDCCKCSKRFLPFKNYVKPYSTDIATAMELWEEMKAAGVMLTLQYHKNSGIGCRLSLTNEEAFFDRASMSSYAETEADAISGAWLKWKRG